MNLFQSLQRVLRFSRLREMVLRDGDRRSGKPRDLSGYAHGASADEIADVLAGNGFGGGDPEKLRHDWIASDRFIPMTVPVDLLHPVRDPRTIKGTSRTVGPVVVDVNFRGQGQDRDGSESNFRPTTFIIDGQHRHAEAKAAGRPTIHALVGDRARPHILAAMFQREHDSRKE